MTPISSRQTRSFARAIRHGLSALEKPTPLTAAEWADENFYLSSESSYHEGRWRTLHYQRAILNAMGSDSIRTVNVMKSARLGFTKMLLAATAYYLEHKRRNVMTFAPTDSDADNFSKSHIDTMVRDVPVLRAIAPWFGMKHRDNTLNAKVFSNRKTLFIHGGKAARNYREKSVDVVVYDELSGFDPDIEKEGSPTILGDKRLEGSTFGKSIRGSTPKIRGECQIERAASESEHLFRFYVPCPHCGHEQSLRWGGVECDYGIKWDPEEGPGSAFYLCESNGCAIYQHELNDESRKWNANLGRWICENSGAWTRDGLTFYDEADQVIITPRSITFHVWTAYSVFTTWAQIVDDFLKSKGDASKLKTFVNTTLGESWEDEHGERIEWEAIYGRREVMPIVPKWVAGLFMGIDTQDDRIEGRVYGFGPGEESKLVDRFILYGDPAGEELNRKVDERIRKQYSREDGTVLSIVRVCWDSGGHYTDEVYSASKRLGVQWVIPIKGASQYGKPIANFPRKRNYRGVYLTEVGTDNAKELIYSRLKIQPEPESRVPGCIHFPADSNVCDEEELRQLTAEVKLAKVQNGRRVYRWDARGRRNEALDCLVYALAALRISQQRFGFSLETEAPKPDNDGGSSKQVPETQRNSASIRRQWIETGGESWL